MKWKAVLEAVSLIAWWKRQQLALIWYGADGQYRGYFKRGGRALPKRLDCVIERGILSGEKV